MTTEETEAVEKSVAPEETKTAEGTVAPQETNATEETATPQETTPTAVDDPEDLSHLQPASARPPLLEYMRQLKERRHFIHAQAWGQATAGHHGTLLGNAWLVIAPMLDGLMYFVIFGLILNVSRGMANFFGYLVIGVFLFSFSARTISHAARCIDGNRGLLRAFSFPRASLPLAVAWRELLSLGPVIGALIVLVAVVPPHAFPTWAWLLLPVVVLMQLGFNVGLALFSARLGARYPDVQHLLPYLTRAWMYGSAVMFSVEQFSHIPRLGPVIENNPLYLALTITRGLLLEGSLAPAELWMKMFLWATLLPMLGLVYFWRAEVTYGRRAYE